MSHVGVFRRKWRRRTGGTPEPNSHQSWAHGQRRYHPEQTLTVKLDAVRQTADHLYLPVARALPPRAASAAGRTARCRRSETSCRGPRPCWALEVRNTQPFSQSRELYLTRTKHNSTTVKSRWLPWPWRLKRPGTSRVRSPECPETPTQLSHMRKHLHMGSGSC